MATLKDKMYDLLRQVRTHLNDTVGYADETGKYLDFEKAFDEVRVTERKLKAVRSHLRTHMRKSKQAFQDACSHPSKVDVRVRQVSTGKRVVEAQACTTCSKSFDLTEVEPAPHTILVGKSSPHYGNVGPNGMTGNSGAAKR